MPELDMNKEVLPAATGSMRSFDALRGGVNDIKMSHEKEEISASFDVIRAGTKEIRQKQEALTNFYNRLHHYDVFAQTRAPFENDMFAQIRASFENDFKFWQAAQKFNAVVCDTLDLISNTRDYIMGINRHEDQGGFEREREYEGSVSRAKEVLREIGVENHFVERVGKEILNVSEAIREKMAELQVSEDVSKGEKLQKAAATLKLIETDFRSQEYFGYQKYFDYNDVNTIDTSVLNEQLDKLEEYRDDTYNKREAIDRTLNDAMILAQAGDKKKFVKSHSEYVGKELFRLETLLFQEIMPRREAKLSIRSGGGKIEYENNIRLVFLDPDNWHQDVKLAKSDSRYRTINRSDLPANACIPTSLLRIYSFYDEEVTASPENFLKKFNEIYNGHPAGEAAPERRWWPQHTESYLNSEIEKSEKGEKGLNIPTSDGKRTRFKVRKNFSYEELKEILSVKDANGNYIPVILQMCYRLDGTEELGFHGMVVRRQVDRDDAQDKHSIKFNLYEYSFVPNWPNSPYGLADLLDITYRQGYPDGPKGRWDDTWTRDFARMGGNRALAPSVETIDQPISEKSAV